MVKVVILPGNGCSNIVKSNWYGWLQRTLTNENIECIAMNMPDPNQARRNIWIPFIHDTLKADSDTILVGHSSGAQAALKYTEKYSVRGVILVSSTFTDLGDTGERASGFYPLNGETENLYDFEAMRRNCPNWHQFHSDNDCFIPLAEAERIRQGLNLENSQYSVLPGRSHFFDPPFPELVEVVKRFVQN